MTRETELVIEMGDISAKFDITIEQAYRIASKAKNASDFVFIWENFDWWVK